MPNTLASALRSSENQFVKALIAQTERAQTEREEASHELWLAKAQAKARKLHTRYLHDVLIFSRNMAHNELRKTREEIAAAVRAHKAVSVLREQLQFEMAAVDHHAALIRAHRAIKPENWDPHGVFTRELTAPAGVSEPKGLALLAREVAAKAMPVENPSAGEQPEAAVAEPTVVEYRGTLRAALYARYCECDYGIEFIECTEIKPTGKAWGDVAAFWSTRV